MAEEKITLTLNPQITEEETVAEPAVQLETADQQQEVKLSPEEQKMVDDFSKQIDVYKRQRLDLYRSAEAASEHHGRSGGCRRNEGRKPDAGFPDRRRS